MADKIKLIPSSMRSSAASIRQFRNENDEVIRKLTNLVNSLSESWRGDAQDAFVSRFAGHKIIFDQFAAAMDEYANYIEVFASDMENIDDTYASRIMNI